MMLSKCAKFQSNRSMDFESLLGGTQTLNVILYYKSLKGHNLVKMPDKSYPILVIGWGNDVEQVCKVSKR